MGQLVGDEVDERPIARQDRRGEEGQARVLHAAVGEGGRHDDHVVALPVVRAEELLAFGQHLLRLGELPGGVVGQVRLGVDGGPRSEIAAGDVADGQGEQSTTGSAGAS